MKPREDTIESNYPKHFLLGASSGVKLIGLFSPDPSILSMKSAGKRHSKAFWRRWMSEDSYLISMRTKCFGLIDPLQEGDAVRIVNPNKLGNWVELKRL